ncbi:MAG: TIM barrel protein [Candidatus Caldatribacteriota bacterium]
MEKSLTEIQDIGFDYAEIPVHGVDAIIMGKLNRFQTRIIADILKKVKLKYTVHGPNLLNLMDYHNFKLQKSIFKAGIEFAHTIGAELFVYHGGKIPLREKFSGEGIIQNSITKIPPRKKIEKLKNIEVMALQELATFAHDLNVVIAVENSSPDVEEEFFWELSKNINRQVNSLLLQSKSIFLREVSRYNYSSKIEELVEQIKKINHKNVGIALDFGHAFLASRYYHFSFLDSIKLALPYLKHIHIHDCFGKPKITQDDVDINLIQFGIGDLHMPIGWGEIPYEKVFPLIKSYKGILCLELKPRYKRFFHYSLQVLRELVENGENNHKINKKSPF